MEFLGKMFGQNRKEGIDEEKDAGMPRAEHLSIAVPNVVDNIRRRTVVPEYDQLTTFRFLVGITTNPSMSAARNTGRSASNIGIYPHVVHNEQKTRKRFKYFSLLINCCLGLQIVVAASLTSLGASGGHNHAVTAFGAINTVIAGFLTFLKGSGLPNRFSYYQNEWSKLRDYIEQRERDFSRDSCTLDVHEEAAIIVAMFEEIKADIYANTPDSYVSVDARRKVAPKHIPSGAPTTQVNQGSERTAESVTNPKASESGFASRLKDMEQKVGEKLVDAGRDVEGFGQRLMGGNKPETQEEVQNYADQTAGQFTMHVTDTERQFGQQVAETANRADIPASSPPQLGEAFDPSSVSPKSAFKSVH